MDKEKTACFIGHRTIKETDALKEKIYNTIKYLIENKNVTTFIFGSKSEFNSLCRNIVTELQTKYPNIKRIYVRAEFQYISDNYKKYLLDNYDDTYFPEKISCAGKASYVERNQIMINKSNYCICYYDENYLPLIRKYGNKGLFKHQYKSGTKIAYKYAEKRGVQIINVLSKAFN